MYTLVAKEAVFVVAVVGVKYVKLVEVIVVPKAIGVEKV
jgi:hypothetical protein